MAEDNKTKEKYFVGSLFAGIGGICSAFAQKDFKILWANELDKNTCKTYRHNYSYNLREQDICLINNPEDLGYVDVLTSGFPCQAFSIAGYREGFNDKKGRGNLFFETARFIKILKPKAYLLENVRNLVGHDNGQTFKAIKETLVNNLGYSFIPFVLNAKDFNIPQNRERIYIVGFRNESQFEFNINENPYNNTFMTQNNYKNNCSCNFKIPKQEDLQVLIKDIIEKEKVDEKYYYKETHQYYPLLKKAMTNKYTIYQWRRTYVRENKNNLCPTLTANMGTGGHNVPLIIDDLGIRKLTPKECLRFQGFEDKFEFPKNISESHQYKQVGNSVVVPVVKKIAESIMFSLNIKNCSTFA